MFGVKWQTAIHIRQESVERITKEWLEIIDRDYSHPSIIAWVPLNESWGVPRLLADERQVAHSLSLYYLTKSLDPHVLLFQMMAGSIQNLI